MSFRACIEMSKALPHIFPDSKIARSIHLYQRKMKNYTVKILAKRDVEKTICNAQKFPQCLSIDSTMKAGKRETVVKLSYVNDSDSYNIEPDDKIYKVFNHS